MRFRANSKQGRRGAAVVEMALIAPVLVFLLLVAIDYCRIFYFTQIVSNCARNGGLYVTDSVQATWSPYATMEEAAKADATADLRSQLTVTSATGTDTIGAYTTVTVTYPFKTFTNYPGLPQNVTISRTVQVRIAPVLPR
jgi:Flp pilus assembly protein TadG